MQEIESMQDYEREFPGYKLVDATVSAVWANILSIGVMVASFFIFTTLHSLLRPGVRPELTLNSGLFVLVGLLVGVVLHEGAHALGWKLAGGLEWSQIKFGFMARYLMPYTHVKTPLEPAAFRLGVLLPALLTGLLPALLGIVLNVYGLTVLGAVLFASASGDFMVLWVIRRAPPGSLIIDHPKDVGCMILVKE
jgi:hypothetical protein